MTLREGIQVFGFTVAALLFIVAPIVALILAG